jgi:hypothetical protein
VRFSWQNTRSPEAPHIYVDCEESFQGRKDAQCRMQVGADALLTLERDKQAALDVQRRRSRQPAAAPSL